MILQNKNERTTNTFKSNVRLISEQLNSIKKANNCQIHIEMGEIDE